MATKKGTAGCRTCGGEGLLWTFVYGGKIYQSADHGRAAARRKKLGASSAQLARRPKAPGAIVV